MVLDATERNEDLAAFSVTKVKRAVTEERDKYSSEEGQ